ncbi:MAG: hypothetical protein KA267_11120 [Gemmatimonadales bacterium]|jgi:hypothetical protein|nr:hypothetical protein [Gemmatimonadales bacterium]MBP6570747.1 hypothetical protein [Gemmatimonadales bacterium]
MRPLSLLGIALICVGAFLLIRGGTFTTRKDVLKVGDVKVTADDEQTIPPWVGGVAVIAGVVVVAAGMRQRS